MPLASIAKELLAPMVVEFPKVAEADMVVTVKALALFLLPMAALIPRGVPAWPIHDSWGQLFLSSCISTFSNTALEAPAWTVTTGFQVPPKRLEYCIVSLELRRLAAMWGMLLLSMAMARVSALRPVFSGRPKVFVAVEKVT